MSWRDEPCADPECNMPIGPKGSRGMCNRHYLRWWRANRETVEIERAERSEPLARIAEAVSVESPGCWIWQGVITGGYGRIGANGRYFQAHRWVYEQLVGPIPEGLQLDHLCRVTSCVNPDHLEPVTPRENTLRSAAVTALRARKTHCPRGHEYDAVTKAGYRWCRRCMRDHGRRYRERQAALR